MPSRISIRAARTLVAFGTVLGLAHYADAQTFVEHSNETRFQLDLQVPDAALMNFIPEGWTLNVSARGPAKDANLRAIFVDRVTINGQDGTPVGTGSNRLVYLAAPATSPTGENVQLIIGGLTEEPSDAPGPFGVYLLATKHTMERTTTSGASGPILDTQDWMLSADTGEHIEMHIQYERGGGNKRDPRDTKFYSANDPDFYQISRQEQVLDILRNVTTTPPDRVKNFSFSAGGGSYAELFDGTQRVLSWDNILWLNRSVLLP